LLGSISKMGESKNQIDNNLVENSIQPTALGKRTGSSSAMPMPANAAPSSTPSSRVAAPALGPLPARRLTRLPSTTNWRSRRLPKHGRELPDPCNGISRIARSNPS
jgi:hypothetical protein